MEGMGGFDDDEEGDYADDADHLSHQTSKRRDGSKHAGKTGDVVKEGPIDRHVKRLKN